MDLKINVWCPVNWYSRFWKSKCFNVVLMYALFVFRHYAPDDCNHGNRYNILPEQRISAGTRYPLLGWFACTPANWTQERYRSHQLFRPKSLRGSIDYHRPWLPRLGNTNFAARSRPLEKRELLYGNLSVKRVYTSPHYFFNHIIITLITLKLFPILTFIHVLVDLRLLITFFVNFIRYNLKQQNISRKTCLWFQYKCGTA